MLAASIVSTSWLFILFGRGLLLINPVNASAVHFWKLSLLFLGLGRYNSGSFAVSWNNLSFDPLLSACIYRWWCLLMKDCCTWWWMTRVCLSRGIGVRGHPGLNLSDTWSSSVTCLLRALFRLWAWSTSPLLHGCRYCTLPHTWLNTWGMHHIGCLRIRVAAVPELSLITSKSWFLLAISKSRHEPCSRGQRVECWILFIRVWSWWEGRVTTFFILLIVSSGIILNRRW